VAGFQSLEATTTWLVGDSTVNVGSAAKRGWGTALPECFNTDAITIENQARGGRSSRTFRAEGAWQEILDKIHPGDYVLIQFGHNDSSPVAEEPPINDMTRCRGTFAGTGAEGQEVDNILTGKREFVYSYGEYLRRYVQETLAACATPVIISPIPKRGQFVDGKALRNWGNYASWAEAIARQLQVPFLDLNERVASKYDQMGKDASSALFMDAVHTCPDGARLNARCVAEGISELSGVALGHYLNMAALSDDEQQ
jgi:rhamnogalacturonan acetylesterase